jgi:hypothetical protein
MTRKVFAGVAAIAIFLVAQDSTALAGVQDWIKSFSGKEER